MDSSEPGGTPAGMVGAQRGWWLEDAEPGKVIAHPGGRTIAEGEHVWLAWVTHNISDVHGNADAARGTEWGQPLVLGMLSAAIVIGLAEPATGPPESAAGTLGTGWQDIRLERAVQAGDTLRARSSVEQVEPSDHPGWGMVRRTIVGLNQAGDAVVRIRERRGVPSRAAGAASTGAFQAPDALS